MSVDKEELIQHPAFGTVQISRFTGGDFHLFGSNLKHSGGVALRVTKADLRRHLHEDWIHPSGEIVEVYMSEAQFAHMIASMNMGSGTPCTIQHIQGKRMERIPPRPMVEQFKNELKEEVQQVASGLGELIKQIETLRAQKTIKKSELDAVLAKASNIHQDIVSNLPFVHTQLEEAMDKTVNDGRIEIEAHITNAIKLTGLKALADAQTDGEIPKLTLPE